METINYSDIIKNQATMNIGCIGHVSHGKSSVVRLLSGVKTQKHKKELERNITIKLGYANFKIWYCPKTRGIFYSSGNIMEKVHPENNTELILLRQCSFVDCPGHESFMTTMIGGTSVMGCAFLLIDASCMDVPQLQTYEHLMVVSNTDIKDIFILQNKIDLVNDNNDLIDNKNKIKEFVNGSVAQDSPIIPISAQFGMNVDEVCKHIINSIPIEITTINEPLYMPIIRSFDANKPKTMYDKIIGGIIGTSVQKGVLNVGEYIQISPGIVTKKGDKVICTPIITKVISICSEQNKLDRALPGGLIGIGTTMDSYLCGSNRLVGQLVGKVNSMPEIYKIIELDIKLLKRADLEKTKYKEGEVIKLCIHGYNNNGIIIEKLSKKRFKVKLDIPISCNLGEDIAIMKKIDDRFILYSMGKIIDGIRVDEINYPTDIGKYTSDSEKKYKIVYDLDNIKPTISTYDQLISNRHLNDISTNTLLKLDTLSIERKARYILVKNMYAILKKIHNTVTLNIENQVINYFNLQLNKTGCRFNGAKEFIISGKLTPKQVNTLLSKYISKYAICNICKSKNIELIKKNRLLQKTCLDCKSIENIN